MKLRVLHREDNLLRESAERYKDEPRPTEPQLAHRMLFAFVEELRQAGEFTLDELIGRIQAWRAFAMDHGYQIGDNFWGELMIGGDSASQMVIQTRDSHMGGHFVCAVIERAAE